MGRKKIENVEEGIPAPVESTETREINAAELEAEEALLLDEATESELTEETPAEEETKPRRRSRARKAKPTAEAEKAEASDANQPLNSEQIAAFKSSVEKSMDAMVRQWGAVKEITTSVTTDLEKIVHLVQELSPEHTADLESLIQQPEPKPVFMAKFATAASLVAALLSVLSLSLSRSAREAALDNSAPRIAQSTSASNPYSAPEIAANFSNHRWTEEKVPAVRHAGHFHRQIKK